MRDREGTKAQLPPHGETPRRKRHSGTSPFTGDRIFPIALLQAFILHIYSPTFPLPLASSSTRLERNDDIYDAVLLGGRTIIKCENCLWRADVWLRRGRPPSFAKVLG